MLFKEIIGNCTENNMKPLYFKSKVQGYWLFVLYAETYSLSPSKNSQLIMEPQSTLKYS